MLTKLFNISLSLLCLFLVALGGSYFLKDQWPRDKQIDTRLFAEPIQTDTVTKPYPVAMGDTKYSLLPVDEYDLYGMVVSTDGSGSWLSRIRDNDPLKVADLCIIWGDNLKNGSFKTVRFKSEKLFCYWENKTETTSLFKDSGISNNHILNDNSDSALYRQLRQVRVGDQVHIKGQLVNYNVTLPQAIDPIEHLTSTIRTDSGPSSGENIYVKEFERISRGNSTFSNIYYFTKTISTYLALLSLFIYILIIFMPSYSGREDERGIKEKYPELLPIALTKRKIFDKKNKGKE